MRSILNFRTLINALTSSMFLLGGLTAGHAEAIKPSFVSGGELVVCIDPTFPPMEFFRKAGDTEPVGVDVDVINALAKHWNIKPKLMTMDFDGLLPSLEAKKCDAVISGTSITPPRIKTLAAIPYINTSVVIITKTGNKIEIKDPKDLSGKVVAVQSGTQYVDRVNKVNAELKAAGAKEIDMQVYPKQTDVIQQILVGRAQAAYTQDTENAFRSIDNPGKFSLIYTYPDAQQMGIFIRPNADDEKAINAAVAALVKDGSLPAIIKNWKLSTSQLNGIGK